MHAAKNKESTNMIDLSCIKNTDPEIYEAMAHEVARKRGNI